MKELMLWMHIKAAAIQSTIVTFALNDAIEQIEEDTNLKLFKNNCNFRVHCILDDSKQFIYHCEKIGFEK